MLDAERGHRNGDEHQAQKNDLIQALMVRKLLPERAQANDQDNERDEIG
jgi:hypothetical protein